MEGDSEGDTSPAEGEKERERERIGKAGWFNW